jgi:hypothetical protein
MSKLVTMTTETKVGKGKKKGMNRSQQPVTMQQVRSLIAVAQEFKFFDSKVYATATTSSGQQYAVSAIPQGDTDSNRDGDQVNLQRLEIYFATFLQGTGGTNDFTDTVRLIVYRWHPMSTAAAPVPANVLQDTSVAESIAMSNYSWDNRKDYTILFDKHFDLSGNGPSQLSCTLKKTWKPPGLPAHFSAGSTSLQSNGIFVIVASDSLVATHPLFNLYVRTVYSDA